MGFKFPAFAHSLCHFFALGQLLVDDCESKSLLGSCLSALGLYSPACSSHLGDLTWGCAGQMAWLGATDQTGIWMCPSAFFLILHGPAGLSPACCHTLCVLDGFSVFCSVHFPQEETPSSVSVGLSLRYRLPENLSLYSLVDAFL